jgi:hypothetical protein
VSIGSRRSAVARAACFDWTEDVSLETALGQQEALSGVIDAAPLVVKTAVLEQTTEE